MSTDRVNEKQSVRKNERRKLGKTMVENIKTQPPPLRVCIF